MKVRKFPQTFNSGTAPFMIGIGPHMIFSEIPTKGKYYWMHRKNISLGEKIIKIKGR